MRGYVQNTGDRAFFVLQRQLPPGGKLTLENAYKVVGKKSGVKEEQVEEFAVFLKDTALARGSWEFFEDDGTSLGVPKKKKVAKKDPAPSRSTEASIGRTSSKVERDARGAGRNISRNRDEAMGKEITPAVIIEASYEIAGPLIEKCNDKGTLKKALNASQHFAGKEQHMRHLMKRLEQVY